MIIFRAFSTSYVRRQDIERGERAIEAIAADGRWEVINWPCSGPYDYSDGLARVWSHPGDLLIVEHDLAPTIADVARIELCLHPRCAGAYWMSSVTTGRLRPSTSALNRLPSQDFVPPGTPWADLTGIGFARIKESARRRAPVRAEWGWVCEAVNNAVGGPWHIHWPTIPHHHGLMEVKHVGNGNGIEWEPSRGHAVRA